MHMIRAIRAHTKGHTDKTHIFARMSLLSRIVRETKVAPETAATSTPLNAPAAAGSAVPAAVCACALHPARQHLVTTRPYTPVWSSPVGDRDRGTEEQRGQGQGCQWGMTIHNRRRDGSMSTPVSCSL